MDEEILRGRISFVNYEKHFATIEYLSKTKKKSVNCKTNISERGSKPHYFRIGDEVNFQLRLSDRGDKMTAYNVRFLFNQLLEQLVQKATIENRFSGYLKVMEEELYVKEWNSYLFFPLQLSPWEKPPSSTAENEAISFRLLHLDKPASITAELFSHNYIPEYKQALQHYEAGNTVDSIVYKVSRFAVYVHLLDNKITAKLSLQQAAEAKEGDHIAVRITHLSPMKIAVERIDPVSKNK